jgi:hypothetical protein
MKKSSLEASCPLCGGDNACAMARGDDSAQACWCVDATISPEALAAIPEADKGRRCLCAECAKLTGDFERAR